MEQWVMLGLTAGFLTTIGYIPQLVKGYKTHKMDDVSVMMPLLLSVGMGLWLCYGIVTDDVPIIFWNAVSVGLNVVLIVMKYRYRKAPRSPDESS